MNDKVSLALYMKLWQIILKTVVLDIKPNYLCGPPVMIDSAISTLRQSRLLERDIHTVRFLSAADGASGDRRSALFKHI